MNYTKNYHLPQWDETDRIMRTDFNQMCADMEGGLLKTARDAAEAVADAVSKAETAVAGAAANAAKAAQKAQSTADKAVADAAKAQAKADAAYSPSQPPYTIGTYLGDGKDEQAVRVGFKPRFLIISGGYSTATLIAAGPEVDASRHLAFTDTGFTVKIYHTGDPQFHAQVAPYLCQAGTIYTYIAFR